MMPPTYNANLQILQTAELAVIRHEMMHDVRMIYLDGRPHPPPSIQWLAGHSVGRFEGETLVVDTTGFNDQTWFDRAGNFHSDALHVVERITAMGPDHLNYEATVEDSKVFSRPWKMSMPLYRRKEKGARLLEFRCVEFVEELMYGQFRKPGTRNP